MILLIDNYDSFSYNLYQQIGGVLRESECGAAASLPEIRVIRNDEASPRQIMNWAPSHIVLSPGPGRPEDAGICVDLVGWTAGRIPILGVCLGHQAICTAFGARVSYARKLMHGKASRVTLDTDSAIFRGMPAEIEAGRYHSLSAVGETIPGTLKVTARASDGEVMAVEHRDYRVYGVQFHPESILTPLGAEIMRNFLCGDKKGGEE